LTNRNTKQDTRYGVELTSPVTLKVANTPQLMKKKDNYAVKIHLRNE